MGPPILPGEPPGRGSIPEVGVLGLRSGENGRLRRLFSEEYQQRRARQRCVRPQEDSALAQHPRQAPAGTFIFELFLFFRLQRGFGSSQTFIFELFLFFHLQRGFGSSQTFNFELFLFFRLQRGFGSSRTDIAEWILEHRGCGAED